MEQANDITAQLNSMTLTNVKEPGDDKYVVLCETSGEECESWYYFLRYGDNKDALEYLSQQLASIDMEILDDLSTFDLDLEHFFSLTTAKEMIRLEVNTIYHRKFDGKLKLINLGLKRKDNNDRKLEKLNDILGDGAIEDFIDNEDTEGCSNYNSEEEGNEDGSSSEDEELFPNPKSQDEEGSGSVQEAEPKLKVPSAIQKVAGKRKKKKH